MEPLLERHREGETGKEKETETGTYRQMQKQSHTGMKVAAEERTHFLKKMYIS